MSDRKACGRCLDFNHGPLCAIDHMSDFIHVVFTYMYVHVTHAL